MAFQPRKGDTPAPVTFRRFMDRSPRELVAAYQLINTDYEHVTSEQLLNVVVELKRRNEVNRLDTLLNRLADKRAQGDPDEPTTIKLV